MPNIRNTVVRNEVIRNYETKQQINNDQSVLRRYIDLSEQGYDTCVLVFVGDWHIGSVDFDINEAIKVLNYVLQTPNARLLCLGDMMNTALINSVSDSYEDIAYPSEQWELFVSLMRQVSEQDKLVVVHTGNHERRIAKNAGIDPVKLATTALDKPEAYAPYFADTTIVLKSNYTKSGSYAFPVVTHHGDNGNPEANSEINSESLINGIGHTHNFRAYTTTKIITSKSNRSVKKDELNIVIPAAGGGLYGSEKGYKPLNKCPYYAMEVTTAPNPLYDPNNLSNMQQKVILAHKSMQIVEQASSDAKEACIKEGKKIVDSHIKLAQTDVYTKLFELLEVLEKCGMEINKDLKVKIASKTVEAKHSKQQKTSTIKKLSNSVLFEDDMGKE